MLNGRSSRHFFRSGDGSGDGEARGPKSDCNKEETFMNRKQDRFVTIIYSFHCSKSYLIFNKINIQLITDHRGVFDKFIRET